MSLPPSLALAGRYLYDREIGEGGGGRIVRALDQTTGDPVALKLVPPSAFALLRAEREALSSVAHPCVVRVIELLRISTLMAAPWSLPAGSGILVEEFVAGQPLGEFWFGESVSERLASFWPLAVNTVEGLSALHGAGLVHGDLSLQNVLVREEGSAVLIDLGLAGPPRATAATLSGTPGFFAPESLLGARTFATDLFALGVLFRHMLGPAELHAPVQLRELVDGLLMPSAHARPRDIFEVAERLQDMADLPGSAGERVASASARALAYRALDLPFEGHHEELEELSGCLRAGGLVWVVGPDGSGRSRLIREAVGRLQREESESKSRVSTYVRSLQDGRDTKPPKGPYVFHGTAADESRAHRALAAAALDTTRVTWVLEVASTPARPDFSAPLVTLGPLPLPEFESLLRRLVTRPTEMDIKLSTGLIKSALSATAGLAGRLCVAVSDLWRAGLNPRRARSFDVHAAPGKIPAQAADLALRLALAGGALDSAALGDAACSASVLLGRGVLYVDIDGQFCLVESVIAPLLQNVPKKRRAAVAQSIHSESAHARAHLTAHAGRGGESRELFASVMTDGYNAGRTSEVVRVGEEAVRLGVAVPKGLVWRALVSSGDYATALDVCETPAERAETLRRLGRREEAFALASSALEHHPTCPALHYTLAWLAIGRADLAQAKVHGEMCEPALGAEVRAWIHLSRGEHEYAESVLEVALANATPRMRARLLSTLGTCQRAQPRRAAETYRDGLALSRSFGERHLEAGFDGNLGAVLLSLGQLGPASEALTRAAHAMAWLQRPRDLGRALFNLAHLERLVGDTARARLHFTQAQAAAQQGGDEECVQWAWVGLAEIAAVSGKLEPARALLKRLSVLSARERLAAAVAGAAPDLAADLLRKESARLDKPAEPSDAMSADARVAHARVCIAAGGNAEPWLHALEQDGGDDWEHALRVALLGLSVHRDGRREHAAARARALLDLATGTLSPNLRDRMRQVPAYAPALVVRPLSARAADDRRWRRLGRVAKHVTSSMRSDEVWKEVTRSALELVDAERASIVRRETDGSLHVLSDAGAPGGDGGISRSVVARALIQQTPVTTMDALEDVQFGAASIHMLALRSLLCVPLPRRPEVLYIEDRMRPAAFDDDDVALISDLADLATLAADRVDREMALTTQANELKHARRILEERATVQAAELRALKDDAPDIVANSPSMRKTLALARRVASANVPALIIGPSGAGKEVVAKQIHRWSSRHDRPFITENCGAIPESLMESQLFGHERGAFTGADSTRVGLFEAAHRGTLFLDEVAEMSPSMQSALLRVVQDGEIRRLGSSITRHVDVRLIAATREDLKQRVADGLFREDLYYRLAVVTIELEPLSARQADIPPLVARALARHGRSIDERALEALVAFDWPGNIRQLHNELERAVILAEGRIHLEHLSPALRSETPIATSDFKSQVAALEYRLITQALRRNQGNITRTATELGLSRYGLQKMIKRLEIDRGGTDV